MNVHLVPCGTSLLENLRFRQPIGVLADLADGQPPAGDPTTAQLMVEVHAAVTPELDDVLDQLARVPVAGRPSDSAEVSALTESCTADDRVVLLASDSTKGVIAAVLVAHLWAARAGVGQGSIAIWADHLPTGADGPESGPIDARIHVVLVHGLEATSADQLHQGIASLLRILASFGHQREATLGAQQLWWHLHLSGGFKAALPYIITVVGLMEHHIGPARADVHFEEGALIPVPVAPLDAGRWLEASAAFDPDEPLAAALYGDGDQPTPFCLALRTPDIARLLQ